MTLPTFIAGDGVALAAARDLPEAVGRVDLGADAATVAAALAGVQMSLSARHDGGPAGLLLGVVLSDGCAELAEPAGALFPEALRPDAVRLLPDPEGEPVGAWCWRRLAALTAHLLREHATAHLALAEARATQSRLERSLLLAEAALTDARREPLKLALRLDPSGVFAATPKAACVLTQHIPVPLANVIYVDLFFSRDGAGATGHGTLGVGTSYGHTTLCECRFRLDTLRRGWNRFACHGRNLTLAEPLDLTLALEQAAGTKVTPGLSAATPLDAHAAALVGHGPLRRPLALRVWTGIAGLDYPRHVTALTDDAGNGQTLALPVELLAAARPYPGPRGEVEFRPVAFLDDRAALLVHPLGRTPTVAQLPGILVHGLRAVSVTVTLRHPDAKPTECRILASPTGHGLPRLEDPPTGGGFAGAGWVALAAGEAADLHADLPEPYGGLIDIYLASRSVGTAFDLSWALFHGVRLHCGAGPA